MPPSTAYPQFTVARGLVMKKFLKDFTKCQTAGATAALAAEARLTINCSERGLGKKDLRCLANCDRVLMGGRDEGARVAYDLWPRPTYRSWK